MTGHLADGVLGLWRSAKAFADDRWRRMATIREVDALEPHERARVLGEAGLTRKDFADAMRTPFVSDDLLSQAMRALGIGPAAFRARHDAWYRDMQRVCMACHARSGCRRDLAARDFARRFGHYCPNAGSLAQIAAGAGPEALTARPAGRA